MQKYIRGALVEDIKYWKKILKGNVIYQGRLDSALCRYFYWEGGLGGQSHNDEKCTCIGYPVFEKTKLLYCRNTPIEKWNKLETQAVCDDESRKIAVEQINFLESLLLKRKTKGGK